MLFYNKIAKDANGKVETVPRSRLLFYYRFVGDKYYLDEMFYLLTSGGKRNETT